MFSDLEIDESWMDQDQANRPQFRTQLIMATIAMTDM
jgi:hypothetical protein